MDSIIDRLKTKTSKVYKEVFSEQSMELLEEGDLVIPTIDIYLMEGAHIAAGHVFEFKEEYLPYINSPLLKPNQKQIIDFTLNQIKDNILSHYDNSELKLVLTGYIDMKLNN